MKRFLLLLMVVATACVSLTWGDATVEAASPVNPQQYQPNEMTKFKIQGDGAFAHFVNSDDNPNPQDCGGTSDIQIGANDEVIKEGSGKAETTSEVFLIGYISNYCTGLLVSFANNFTIPPEAFTIGDKLGSATLNTVVEACCDNNGSAFPVTINLTWTATGPVIKGKSSFTSKSPGCKMTSTVNGDYRDAVATGSITVFDNELALQPLVAGSTQSVKAGEITIGCD